MVSKATGQATAARSTRSTSPPTSRTSSRSMPNRKIDYGLVLKKKIDAVYVTRFQKERWAEKERPYPKIDAKFLGQPKYSRSERHAPAAAGQRARRLARYRPPRDLFPAGGLRRAGAHGADFAAAASAQEQVAAQIRRRLRQARASPSTCSRSAPASNASTRTASPAIRPSGNTPPTSFMSSKTTRRSAARLRCLYCETDIDAEAAAHFVVGDTARKTYSPGLGGARAGAGRASSSISSFTPAKPKRWRPAFSRATAARGCAPASDGAVRNKPLIWCCPGESATSFSAARASCQT